jgi:alginate O-acetyltransferase complex protein AlgI
MSWIGVLAYTLQIYYDFSGYSDMAIGLGALFGFKFMENFNYPYISKSVTEFWRRWHISLSTWFREYLYIPLGGNRVSKWRNICNLFIVFLATGIWHGASWNFVLWGVWHGLFLALEKFTKIHEKIPRVLSHICTAAVFFFGWILFRSPTAADALAMVKRMTGFAEKSEILLPAELFLNNEEIMVFAAALFLIFPVWGKWAGLSAEKLPIPLWRRVAVNTVLCLLFILSVMKIATTTSNPFIYFRF